MQQLIPNQNNAHVPVNENFATLGWASVYGNDPATTAGLHRGYLGGRWGGFTVAAVDHTFGASVTTYVCVTVATGALDFSTSSTNYLNTASYAPVETVVTGASAVTGTTDDRAAAGGVWNRAGAAGSGDMVLASAQTVTGAKTFEDGTLKLAGSTSGAIELVAPAVAGAGTVTLPASGTLATASDIASAIAAIGLSGFRYKIELADTTASDPGAGLLKFNNATPASATALYLDDSTFDSVDLSTLLGSLGSSGLVKITSVADVGEWRVFKWTAAPTDNTGWWTFTVVDQAGTGTFEDDDEVQVLFLQLGATGVGGDTLSSEGALIASATAKTTPVDADYIGLMDSAASNVLKKLSWLNIKATLKTYFDTLYIALSTVNAFTKNQSVTPVALTDAATIATDASLSNNFTLTMLTTGRVMGAPTNPTDGMVCNWAINSGAGAFTMTWASAFDFGGAGAPTHSVTASKVDLVSGYYHGGTSKWLVSFRKGS